MPDQQRADCMSCAGNERIRTPNMDRLAAKGVRFANAYTASPICMPARSSFHCGQYPHNHYQWGNQGYLRPEMQTYARSLRDAGYHTAHIGKSHMFPHPHGLHLSSWEPYMHAIGWDDVREVTGPMATLSVDSIMTDHWRELGCLDTFRDDYARRREGGWARATWPSPMPQGEHADDFVGRSAVEYLAGYDRDEPFCVFVGFGGPHDPWDPPQDWAAQYDPADMTACKPATAPGPWVPPAAADHQRLLQDRDTVPDPDWVARMRALYYAKCSHIDSWFGRILETLEERGVLDNTVIVHWSDHGEMLGDKGRVNKAVFYEEAARVPLIVRVPNAGVRGAVSGRLVSILDVYPTLLDLAGCGDEEWRGFGRSLLPLLDHPSAQHHDAVFSEIGDRTMIRTERHKMVLNSAGDVLKLYDMQDDPGEVDNLVGADGTKPVVAELRERMLTWLLATQKRWDMPVAGPPCA